MLERRGCKRDALSVQSGTLQGYAAVYNQESVVFAEGTSFAYREIFLPKCFKWDELIAIYNHDTSMVLGSISGGHLTVEDTDEGLKFSLKPVETSYSADVVRLVESGAVSGCSVGFNILEDDYDVKNNIFQVVSANLVEMSITAFPAYPQTSVTVVRSSIVKNAKSTQKTTLKRTLELYELSSKNPRFIH
jgi:HK97 family phage prohead protease